MEIKGSKRLSDFEYIVMFDLASRNTGVCLWSVERREPIRTDMIIVGDNSRLPVEELFSHIDCYFEDLWHSGYEKEKVLVYKEAMPVQVHGGASTVQTFVAMARSHAILDFYLNVRGIPTYDITGVYPITTHSHLRHLLGLDSSAKIGKEDIRQYVCRTYGLSEITYDEADAVFLAQTFVEVKWNSDIANEIQEIKKHIKTLKNAPAIKKQQARIEALEKLKV